MDGDVPLGADGDDDGGREIFHTDAGREVLGGGGISPDLSVPRVPEPAVETFFRAMNRYGAAYSDAVFDYATEYASEHPALRPDFEVTPDMLDGLYDRLAAGDVDLPRETYDGAREWLARQLGYRIAYTRWGQEAARKRWNGDDPDVIAARDVLRQATNPGSVFAAAAAHPLAQEDPEPATAAAGAGRP